MTQSRCLTTHDRGMVCDSRKAIAASTMKLRSGRGATFFRYSMPSKLRPLDSHYFQTTCSWFKPPRVGASVATQRIDDRGEAEGGPSFGIYKGSGVGRGLSRVSGVWRRRPSESGAGRPASGVDEGKKRESDLLEDGGQLNNG
jgi:hypothetical protein